MLKRIFILIFLLLALVLFARPEDKNSSSSGSVKQIENDPIKIENTIELNQIISTTIEPYQDSKIYKEIQYAKKLYQGGDHIKAKMILNILKKDDNKALSERAHYLCLKWYNSLFIPIDAIEDTKYVVDTKELNEFKIKFPGSRYIEELEYVFGKDLQIFNLNVHNTQNLHRIDLNDSCLVRYKSDSTYVCSFHGKYITNDKKEHDLIIRISCKINKYEPMGYLNDEWNSKGLLINDDSTISIKVDNVEKIVIRDYIEHKQQPKYEIREIIEYGSNLVKRFIREDNVENITQLATYLDEDFIIPNFKIQFIYGKINELIPENESNVRSSLNERFSSKCFVEFKMDELKK